MIPISDVQLVVGAVFYRQPIMRAKKNPWLAIKIGGKIASAGLRSAKTEHFLYGGWAADKLAKA